jgi:hypothetical protein
MMNICVYVRILYIYICYISLKRRSHPISREKPSIFMLSHSHPFWGPGAREVQPRCHGGNASLKIKSLLLSRCLVMIRDGCDVTSGNKKGAHQGPWGPALPRVRNCLGNLWKTQQCSLGPSMKSSSSIIPKCVRVYIYSMWCAYIHISIYRWAFILYNSNIAWYLAIPHHLFVAPQTPPFPACECTTPLPSAEVQGAAGGSPLRIQSETSPGPVTEK